MSAPIWHRPDVVLELSHTEPGWTFCLGCGLRWPCPGSQPPKPTSTDNRIGATDRNPWANQPENGYGAWR